ncbi:MAG: phosphate-starvation-inducible PsiE family protein [Synechococcales cyanobacterium RM1_1_8]|nr:phosphate-starvation-inducible PsiE family protein [Synechococcales cyanobacterium RM1_1_8]
MQKHRRPIRAVQRLLSDKGFRLGISNFESFIAKVLAIAMVIVILVSVWDLSALLLGDIFLKPALFLDKALLEIFGLFLSVLIALELLQNITAYLQDHKVQLELVIVTSLTAVARKIILLDLSQVTGLQLMGLAVAVLSLSISYGMIKLTNRP